MVKFWLRCVKLKIMDLTSAMLVKLKFLKIKMSNFSYFGQGCLQKNSWVALPSIYFFYDPWPEHGFFVLRSVRCVVHPILWTTGLRRVLRSWKSAILPWIFANIEEKALKGPMEHVPWQIFYHEMVVVKIYTCHMYSLYSFRLSKLSFCSGHLK